MRIGVDLGGTKIEIAALGESGSELLRQRIATPTDYPATVRAIAELVTSAESKLSRKGSVGLGIPGTISPFDRLVKNANTTWLNGKPLDRDVSTALKRPVRVANDANCFVLSEATDGAAAGTNIVFGIIAGTGCGGGIAVNGQVLTGAHAIAGEWGHNPLPWPRADELPGPACYCGKHGCIETWCSGPALAADFKRRTGRALDAPAIAQAAATGDGAARAAMEDFLDRFARAIATVVNILDPDVVVIGGGLSNLDILYSELPKRIVPYGFTLQGEVKVVKNRHGDASGVRGAAWLWPEDEAADGLPR
jgi:fructokinase